MKQTHSMHAAALTQRTAFWLALASLPVLAASAAMAGAQEPQSILETDRIIVKYRDVQPAANGSTVVVEGGSSARKARIDRAGQQFGVLVRESHALSNGAKVFRLDRRHNLAEVRSLANEMMMRDASIEYAEPDRIMTHSATATDPRFTDQWHYYDAVGGLRLPTAWDISTGTGVVVAVIDTGYRPHADLNGQILPGYDFISTAAIGNDGNGRDNDATDPGDGVTAGACGGGQPFSDQPSSWHGTHVAGTVAARTNNGAGVAGVAYNAKILPVRVLGKCGGYTSDIADAIIWASGGTVAGVPANPNKARVLNLSLGGGGACSATMQNAVNGARGRGAVVVAAAGNSAMNVSNASPANCAGVIAVAATGRTGGRARYSNFGTLVSVAAPGGDGASGVLSTLNSGRGAPLADTYAVYQGTSMAAPHVAGVAALMLALNTNLTPDVIAAQLKSTARAFPASCTGCGAGIVNARAAADWAKSSAAPVAVAESESNNTIATADPVTPVNASVTGNLGTATDTDYFRVDLPAGKTLKTSLSAVLATANYGLYLYNSAGKQLGVSLNGAGVADTITFANTSTSTSVLYLRVVYTSGGTGTSNGRYALSLTR
ncbi:serine protease [Massilia sp. MP_M2]|uniref:S8 family peptidase n=1 Tax=Massilia sp. MP_M2 TaxID=3071713 RepID=UPI00319EAF51